MSADVDRWLDGSFEADMFWDLKAMDDKLGAEIQMFTDMIISIKASLASKIDLLWPGQDDLTDTLVQQLSSYNFVTIVLLTAKRRLAMFSDGVNLTTDSNDPNFTLGSMIVNNTTSPKVLNNAPKSSCSTSTPLQNGHVTPFVSQKMNSAPQVVKTTNGTVKQTPAKKILQPEKVTCNGFSGPIIDEEKQITNFTPLSHQDKETNKIESRGRVNGFTHTSQPVANQVKDQVKIVKSTFKEIAKPKWDFQRILTKHLDCIEVKTNDKFDGTIVFVNSPSEFFMHKMPRSNSLTRILGESEIYKKCHQSVLKASQFPASEDFLGSYWMCQFNDDKQWYRVRINSKGSKPDHFAIQYVDFGNCEEVKLDQLYVMNDILKSLPVQAFRCGLSNISPLEDSWTLDDNEFLENASLPMNQLKVKVITVSPAMGHSIYQNAEVELYNPDEISGTTINDKFVEESRGRKSIKSNSDSLNSDHENHVPVYNSVTLNDSTISSVSTHAKEVTPKKATTPNRRLITGPPAIAKSNRTSSVKSEKSTTLGLRRKPTPPRVQEKTPPSVQVKSPPITPREPVLVETVEDEWDDDEEEDEIIQGNAYGLDYDDPATAVLGYKPEFENCCRFFATARGCHKGDFCDMKHISGDRQQEMFMNQQAEAIIQVIPGDPLILNNYYFIKISSYSGVADVLSVVLPFGDEVIKSSLIGADRPTQHELKYTNMCKEMQECYSKPEAKEAQHIVPAISSIVAVRDSNGSFFRGQVLDVDFDKGIIDIECIDTGTKYFGIKRKDVFNLMSKFSIIPRMSYLARIKGFSGVEQIKKLIGSEMPAQVIDSGDLDDTVTLALVSWTQVIN